MATVYSNASDAIANAKIENNALLTGLRLLATTADDHNNTRRTLNDNRDVFKLGWWAGWGFADHLNDNNEVYVSDDQAQTLVNLSAVKLVELSIKSLTSDALNTHADIAPLQALIGAANANDIRNVLHQHNAVFFNFNANANPAAAGAANNIVNNLNVALGAHLNDQFILTDANVNRLQTIAQQKLHEIVSELVRDKIASFGLYVHNANELVVLQHMAETQDANALRNEVQNSREYFDIDNNILNGHIQNDTTVISDEMAGIFRQKAAGRLVTLAIQHADMHNNPLAQRALDAVADDQNGPQALADRARQAIHNHRRFFGIGDALNGHDADETVLTDAVIHAFREAAKGRVLPHYRKREERKNALNQVLVNYQYTSKKLPGRYDMMRAHCDEAEMDREPVRDQQERVQNQFKTGVDILEFTHEAYCEGITERMGKKLGGAITLSVALAGIEKLADFVKFANSGQVLWYSLIGLGALSFVQEGVGYINSRSVLARIANILLANDDPRDQMSCCSACFFSSGSSSAMGVAKNEDANSLRNIRGAVA